MPARIRAVLLAVLTCTMALCIGIASAETYEVRRYTSARITNDEADAIFAKAVAILKKDNGDGDVPATITWERDDDVDTFDVGDGMITTQEELNTIFGLEGNLKVVLAVDYCGGPLVSALGCAERPGDDIVVERISDATLEAIAWAHEYGHNKGLTHHSPANSKWVMNSAITTNSLRIDADERDAFEGRFRLRKAVAEKERMADATKFVRHLFPHGLTIEASAHFGREDVPALLKMLSDSKEELYWCNIVTLLCYIGDPKTVDPLLKFLISGEGRISVEHYNAKRAVLMHLGNLINKSGDKAALDYLLKAIKNRAALRKSFRWQGPYAVTDDVHEIHLQKMALWGLGLSGNPQGLKALQDYQRTLRRGTKGLKAVLREATEANVYIAKNGIASYYTMLSRRH